MSLLQLAAASRQTFDAACASFTGTTQATQAPATTQSPGTTQATQGPATTDDTPDDACLAALGRIPASCSPTSENDVDTVCSGECRGFYDDVAANCSSDVSFAIVSNHWFYYPVILQVIAYMIVIDIALFISM